MPEELLLEIPDAGEAFWDAFAVLDRSRTYGGGMVAMPNPIAYSEIVAYARGTGLELDELVAVVQELDQVWLAHAMRRLDPPAQPKGKKKEKA